jgi:hypothetical protein
MRLSVSGAGTSSPSPENIGAYLGELACHDIDVFGGILRTYFKSYDTYDYSEPIRKPVVPPGVTEEDLDKLTPFGDVTNGPGDCCRLPLYGNEPELVSAFYRRLNEKQTCEAAREIPPITLTAIKSMGESLKGLH